MLSEVRKRKPRIHAITNNVTINDCANIILAAGGKPVMASDIREVEEITAQCQGLVLNMGAVSCFDSMLKAGKIAGACEIPIVLDPVGAGASKLRAGCIKELTEKLPITVICGNASEIHAMASGIKRESGVDTLPEDEVNAENLKEHIEQAKLLSHRTGAIVAMTGAIDIVAEGDQVQTITGGSVLSEQITGSGCMLTSLLATYLAAKVTDCFSTVVHAMICMKMCSERAEERTRQFGGGTMSYRMYLIDEVSLAEGRLG